MKSDPPSENSVWALYHCVNTRWRYRAMHHYVNTRWRYWAVYHCVNTRWRYWAIHHCVNTRWCYCTLCHWIRTPRAIFQMFNKQIWERSRLCFNVFSSSSTVALLIMVLLYSVTRNRGTVEYGQINLCYCLTNVKYQPLASCLTNTKCSRTCSKVFQ